MRLGANQYGLFIDGFGLISWRAFSDVGLVTYSVRTLEMEELQIQLKQPLASALLVDWRRLPIWRLLMRLPWTMGYDNIVRVNLQPFAPPADEVTRCMELMTERRVRHLPVTDGGRVIGMVSIGDLVKAVIAEQQQHIEQLESYIHS